MIKDRPEAYSQTNRTAADSGAAAVTKGTSTPHRIAAGDGAGSSVPYEDQRSANDAAAGDKDLCTRPTSTVCASDGPGNIPVPATSIVADTATASGTKEAGRDAVTNQRLSRKGVAKSRMY